MELCTTEMRAVYEARSVFRWPDHAGSLVRGLVGRALRRHGCARSSAAADVPGSPANVPGPCEHACEAPRACTYATLFDPPPCDPPPHRLLASAERPPAPVVLRIPAPGARALAPGDRVEIGVRILGTRSSEEIAAVSAALESMAEVPVGTDGGAWTLHEIRQAGARNRPIAIAPSGTAVSMLRIEFETPAWIETKGRVAADLAFTTLFRAVARRITVACALYGSLAADHDRAFTELDAIAARARVVDRRLRVVSWERLSVERDERHPMRGLVGSLDVEGELGPLVPWLRWGEIVHVGKATSYGLGRMRVEVG